MYIDRILISCPLSCLFGGQSCSSRKDPGQRMSETTRYIKRTGSSGSVLSWLSLFRSLIPSCILLFFFSLFNLFLFLFLLGQNAPASDSHSLPLFNKSDGRCCCRTRSPSVRCMLIYGKLKTQFSLLTSRIAG